MSYWKTMPVVVHDNIQTDTYQTIVSKEFLLDKINKELENPHVEFTYKIYEGNNLNDEIKKEIKLFFDAEYSHETDIHMLYHKDIYNFFLRDSLILILYTPNNEVVGYMVGKKSYINVESKILDMLEVSFFCISRQFRNQHYTPYFINILLREYILRYGIYRGTYAISSNIRSPHYANKQIIHKPLNIPKLIECGFLSESHKYISSMNFEKDNSLDLVYLNNVTLPNNLLNIITNKLKKYQSQNYIVYNDFSLEDISRMFKNKAFHNFLFFNKEKTLCNFVSLYEVEIHVDKVQTSYMSSSIYTMFFEDTSISKIRIILEMIGEYCKTHNILDVLSFFDIFDVNDYETDMRCLYGQGTVKYYIFNYNMLKIPNYKNAYVTI
jgi:hypothetical protein